MVRDLCIKSKETLKSVLKAWNEIGDPLQSGARAMYIEVIHRAGSRNRQRLDWIFLFWRIRVLWWQYYPVNSHSG